MDLKKAKNVIIITLSIVLIVTDFLIQNREIGDERHLQLHVFSSQLMQL